LARDQIFQKNFCDASSAEFRRELAEIKFKKDPNDILAGKGQFLSQDAYEQDLTNKASMEILSSDNYDDELNKASVKVGAQPLSSFTLKKLVEPKI
jgi:hypothetical protein